MSTVMRALGHKAVAEQTCPGRYVQNCEEAGQITVWRSGTATATRPASHWRREIKTPLCFTEKARSSMPTFKS